MPDASSRWTGMLSQVLQQNESRSFVWHDRVVRVGTMSARGSEETKGSTISSTQESVVESVELNSMAADVDEESTMKLE